MMNHDRDACPACHGNDAMPSLYGFEGWTNPERFKIEIRLLIHAVERAKQMTEELQAQASGQLDQQQSKSNEEVAKLQELIGQLRLELSTLRAQLSIDLNTIRTKLVELFHQLGFNHLEAVMKANSVLGTPPLEDFAGPHGR